MGKEWHRERIGAYPNNLLNYGYAILRAATARALVGSGLLPTLATFLPAILLMNVLGNLFLI